MRKRSHLRSPSSVSVSSLFYLPHAPLLSPRSTTWTPTRTQLPRECILHSYLSAVFSFFFISLTYTILFLSGPFACSVSVFRHRRPRRHHPRGFREHPFCLHSPISLSYFVFLSLPPFLLLFKPAPSLLPRARTRRNLKCQRFR